MDNKEENERGNSEWKTILKVSGILFATSLLLLMMAGYKTGFTVSTTDNSITVTNFMQLGSEEEKIPRINETPLYRVHLQAGDYLIFSSVNKAVIYNSPNTDSENIRTITTGDVATVMIDVPEDKDVWINLESDQRILHGPLSKEDAMKTGFTLTNEIANIVNRPDSQCSINSSITRHYGGTVNCQNTSTLFEHLDS